MESNNLIPVWNELPLIKQFLRLQPKKTEDGKEPEFKGPYDEIKLFEKAGKLKIKAKEGNFFLDFDLIIPEEYPAAKP